MPTYEYACRDCGEHLEVVQSFKDDALTECPACHGSLRKVFSAAGLIFKGSGWHVKDYAGSSKSSSSRGSSSESSDGGSSKGSSESSGSSSSGSSSSSSSGSSSSSSSGEAKSA
ncbi:FmdB family zinc ribbon protein [Egicoccus sp. AB-alg2]|uniref:FmdB family zinc ribbon protein n=1 Tax=Egicoccus sp. AB-alg2 TaxID=3242693 RepID=UPI00359DF2F4